MRLPDIYVWASALRGGLDAPWLAVLAALLGGAGLWAAACFGLRPAVAVGRFAGRVFWWPRGRYVLAAAVFLFAAYFSVRPYYWRHRIVDESGYFLQARTYAAGKLFIPEVTPYRSTKRYANLNFFTSPLEVVIRGKNVVFYSPTYPAMLAAGVAVGAPWLPNALCAAAAVLLAAAAAGRAYGPKAGAAAAWFWAASPALTIKGATYLSESAFLCAYVLFLALYFREKNRSKTGSALVLGAVWGLSATIREYSTFAGTVPFVIYWFAVVTRKKDVAKLYFGLGALAAAAPVLLYNRYITGNPFYFPRSAGAMHHFGFHGMPAVRAACKWLWVMNKDALGWPYFSLLPAALALFALRPKTAADKLFVAVVAATVVTFLPVTNPGLDFGTRLYVTAVAATVFLAARLAVYFGERFGGEGDRPRLRAWLHGVLLLLVAAGVVNTAVGAVNEVRGAKAAAIDSRLWETPRLRDALRRSNVHNAVVFVSPWPHAIGAMPNSPRFDDDVIFARDQGGRNAELMARFPGRRFLRCDYRAFDRDGTLVEIPAPSSSRTAR